MHVTIAGRLAALEAAYLEARTARDHLDVARARVVPADTRALEDASAAAMDRAREALASVEAAGGGAALEAEDRRALDAMRAGLEAAAAYALPGVAAGEAAGTAEPAAGGDGYERLVRRLEAAYGAAADAVPVGDETLTRLQVLARLGEEPDPSRRRELFLRLDPLWRAVNGDDGDDSPYAALLRESRARWRAGRSPIEANAAALGVTAADIEGWAEATLDAWRTAFVEPAREAGEPPIEPWDWWWHAGEAQRTLRDALPVEALLPITRAVHASLGADLDALGIVFDIHPRPGRPAVPVAYTTFDGRPHRRADGTWSTGRPTILETLIDGGLDELTELVHETGHALHIAGIRTRPAFADWPEGDALTEALAELVSLDLVEPAWQRRWLPGALAVDERVALRGRYADIVLDAAWALLEIRLHGTDDARPNEVWTAITSRYLGIAPHPEWSWWAMRGQLVEAPGYMANYAIGAVLAEDLRAAIREARGDWTQGDPGWYEWVRDHVYRFGLERPGREVLHEVLGRAPSADALLRQIARARRG